MNVDSIERLPPSYAEAMLGTLNNQVLRIIFNYKSSANLAPLLDLIQANSDLSESNVIDLKSHLPN